MHFLKVFICIGAVDFYIKEWVTKWNSEHWERILKKYLNRLNNFPNEELPKIKELSLNGKMPTTIFRVYIHTYF